MNATGKFFIPGNFDATQANNFRWLDADTPAAASDLVKWTRGQDKGMTQFRPRLLDYTGGSNEKNVNGDPAIMRFGDIVDSSPVPIGVPAESYDLLALDSSFATFRKQYSKRRQVVYVGSNDGMIHAFNAGFFDQKTLQFNLKSGTSGTEVQHPLGSELWAYVPKNLLPHLQWPARKDYSHVYGADLTVRVFSAKIFPVTGDADHPGGWGTVLVGGMRFGGGTDSTGIVIDTDGDPTTTTDRVLTKSAYVVMDVTNPEVPPKLMAEISPPNLQHSTSAPQFVGIQSPNSNSPNKWFLVFGSGPTELSDASYKSGVAPSQKFAQLFTYDLADLSNPTTHGLVKTFTLPTPDVFIGDPTVSDYDGNEKAEAIYFGTIGNPSDSASNQGGLFRVSLGEKSDPNLWTLGQLLSNVNRPFVAAPSITTDSNFNRWVVAGTGRFLASSDKSTANTQTLFGFIDPNKDIGSASTAAEPTVLARDGGTLVDVTNYRVFTNGSVSKTGTSTIDDTFKGITTNITSNFGWKRDFAHVGSPPAPSERGVNHATLFDGILLTTGFTPSTQLCTTGGTSELLGLFFKTGTSRPTGIFAPAPCPTNNCPPVIEPITHVSLGSGLASSVSIHSGTNEAGQTVTESLGTGSGGDTHTTQINDPKNVKPAGEISWREYR